MRLQSDHRNTKLQGNIENNPYFYAIAPENTVVAGRSQVLGGCSQVLAGRSQVLGVVYMPNCSYHCQHENSEKTKTINV